MRKSRGSEEIRMNGEWELVEGRGAVRRTQDASMVTRRQGKPL